MRKKKAYLIGIKGVAMTSLAVYLRQKGYQVTGSDVIDEFHTDAVLAKNKIKILRGFSADNINDKYDLVVVTGAHGGMTNPEAQRALDMGYPTFMHGAYLGQLMKESEGISVAGCHGKTTTASLIASLLTHGGLRPSYLIGTASINDLGDAGHFDRGLCLVAEADEYMTCPCTDRTPRFLWQKPKFLVMTNIEYDHPDAFSTIEDVKEAFVHFANNLKKEGWLVACGDNQNLKDVLKRTNIQKLITYGYSPFADYKIQSYYFGEEVSFMRVNYKDISLGEFMVKIPGRHNLLNALSASIVANLVGLSWEKIGQYLKFFTGTKRRFEKIYEKKGTMLFDDYAHHPSEIIATVNGAREWFTKKRIITIFQPHTFSRTKALLLDFAKSFIGVDLPIICDIYPSAREKFDSTITSKMLANEINKLNKKVVYLKGKKEVIDFLSKYLNFNDMIITLGAGDIFTWHRQIIEVINKL